MKIGDRFYVYQHGAAIIGQTVQDIHGDMVSGEWGRWTMDEIVPADTFESAVLKMFPELTIWSM